MTAVHHSQISCRSILSAPLPLGLIGSLRYKAIYVLGNYGLRRGPTYKRHNQKLITCTTPASPNIPTASSASSAPPISFQPSLLCFPFARASNPITAHPISAPFPKAAMISSKPPITLSLEHLLPNRTIACSLIPLSGKLHADFRPKTQLVVC